MMSANYVEDLANWYLRFSGYFTVPNFTVHPDCKKGSEAEADILAVRFPHSAENPGDYHFERDPGLVLPNAIDFLILEAKSGQCNLGDTWTDPNRENIQYVLSWMGFVSDKDHLEELAYSIYQSGAGQFEEYVVRLVAFGRVKNKGLQERFLDMAQIELLDAVEFLKCRLTTGCAKLHRENWDSYIRDFATLAESGASSAMLLKWTLRRS